MKIVKIGTHFYQYISSINCHEQIEHKKPNTWYEYVDYTKNEKGVSRLGRSKRSVLEKALGRGPRKVVTPW